MKRFLPIKIFSIDYGYGWWWGKRFFFPGIYIVPSFRHYSRCESGRTHKALLLDWSESWNKTNQIYR